MEVVNGKAAMLSNYEVYKLLQETEEDCKKPEFKHVKKHQVNLATISYEARKYLEKTPCKHQSPEVIEEFLRALAPFNLTKAEKLQLLNLRPETPVEIQLIIEESEERLKTDSDFQQLLDIITEKLLPDRTDKHMGDDVDDANDDDNNEEVENMDHE
ncbi:DNA-directed RNA polymerase III subunit RPC9 [Nematostella vectensis]|uniref:DNA-directed RNA polymerase III subunit RPC9 n=1 Tax=Nematostella vectensis TaxID=45351 RepID=UPI002077058F|nr:DNA-directed RNA polymerase III subunit RPC9 [Nematostella vectensis]